MHIHCQLCHVEIYCETPTQFMWHLSEAHSIAKDEQISVIFDADTLRMTWSQKSTGKLLATMEA